MPVHTTGTATPITSTPRTERLGVVAAGLAQSGDGFAQVQVIARQRCDGCHAGQQSGSMAVYATARRFVAPGKPDESEYYLRGLGRGHPPAWGDAAPAVRAWIEGGAAE